MRHEQNLVDLLRPLGVYDLGGRSINRGELGAYGAELDACLEELEHSIQEMNLLTARDFGLAAVDGLLSFHPAAETPEQMGQALAALLRIDGDSFTVTAINDTLSGCGVQARALEGDHPGYVEVLFPDIRGIPAAFGRIQQALEEILPCHLEITYRFWYNTWSDVAAVYPTWGQASAAGKSWYELATLKI